MEKTIKGFAVELLPASGMFYFTKDDPKNIGINAIEATLTLGQKGGKYVQPPQNMEEAFNRIAKRLVMTMKHKDHRASIFLHTINCTEGAVVITPFLELEVKSFEREYPHAIPIIDARRKENKRRNEERNRGVRRSPWER